MGDSKHSGIMGIVGILVCVLILAVCRRVFPRLGIVLLVASGILLVLLLALVVLVIVLAFHKPKEAEGKPTAGDVTAMLSKGRSSLMEIRRLAIRVKNQSIRNLVDDICKKADKILRTVKEQPEDMAQIRRFLNYYLPTLGNILLKYVRVQESGTGIEEMDPKVLACLGDISTAMDKQYSNLFEDDRLDLTVEMEVLTTICRRDGLLDEEERGPQDDGRRIDLTL